MFRVRELINRVSVHSLSVVHGLSRRVGTWVLTTFLVVALVLPALREMAPTRSGWQLFSISKGGVFAQNPKFWMEGRAYGRRDVYQALLYSAAELQRRHPGSYVAYMDVSARMGGPIAKHLSHRNGRDVDVLFFGRSPQGLEPRAISWNTVGYGLNYDCGTRTNTAGWSFDQERAWDFVMALRSNGYANVEKIFVEPCVEEWILAFGDERGAPVEEMGWAQEILRYAGPRSGDHLDHFHIRFSEPVPLVSLD